VSISCNVTALRYAVTLQVCIHLNPLNTELNPIYHLLALLGAHPILHVSRIRVKSSRRALHLMSHKTEKCEKTIVTVVFL